MNRNLAKGFVLTGSFVISVLSSHAVFAVECCRCVRSSVNFCVRNITDLPDGRNCGSLLAQSPIVSAQRLHSPAVFADVTCASGGVLTPTQCRAVADGGVCGGSGFASTPIMDAAAMESTLLDLQRAGAFGSGSSGASASEPHRVICNRQGCTESTAASCGTGTNCTRWMSPGVALDTFCAAYNPTVDRLCLSTEDLECLRNPSCVNAPESTLTANPTSGGAAFGASATERPFTSITPQVGVAIPGLEFADAVDNEGYVTVPFLAQYLAAAYRYATGIVVILAIVMVVYGGFRYMIGSSFQDVARGKEIILDAITGMLLVLAAYTILNTINPETLNLQTLKISTVRGIPESAILASEGSLADDADYAATAGEGLPPPSAGDYRSRMMRLCGAKDGYSLTGSAKTDRLKAIVDGWKRIGSDEGGAIYIRGGNPGCTYGSTAPSQASYLLRVLANTIAPPSLVTLGGACGSVINQARSATKTVAAQLASANKNCSVDWGNEYKRIVINQAKAAGMFCGDCATMITNLYTCFGNRGQQVVMSRRPPRDCGSKPSVPGPYPDSPNYIARYWRPTEGDMDALLGRLQFGDVFAWQRVNESGHVFMYTGGAGLSYQILEMGGGGDSDISSTGGDKASKTAGFSFRLSGIRYTGNAGVFLRATARGLRSNGCIWVWRPLQL